MTDFTPEMIEKTKGAKNAELNDDELDNVAGGNKTFHEVPAYRQCPLCGAWYPMNDICPNCTELVPGEEQ